RVRSASWRRNARALPSGVRRGRAEHEPHISRQPPCVVGSFCSAARAFRTDALHGDAAVPCEGGHLTPEVWNASACTSLGGSVRAEGMFLVPGRGATCEAHGCAFFRGDDMRPLRIFTWHVHGSYLYYLAR